MEPAARGDHAARSGQLPQLACFTFDPLRVVRARQLLSPYRSCHIELRERLTRANIENVHAFAMGARRDRRKVNATGDGPSFETGYQPSDYAGIAECLDHRVGEFKGKGVGGDHEGRVNTLKIAQGVGVLLAEFLYQRAIGTR